MPKVAAIQMTSSDSIAENLKEAGRLIAEAAKVGSNLIVLPEMFATLGMDQEQFSTAYETFGSGQIQDFLAEQASQFKIWLVGGTLPILGFDQKRARASCLVFNDVGQCVARYDKIHLFDVFVIDSQEKFQESQRIEPGEQVVTLDTPFGKLGLAVCYDLRFPELFRKLCEQGAEIIALPAAFTVPTGEAHWEILMRSRAIENSCYMLGAAQWGTHAHGRKTFGDSVIIDPWGKILAQLKAGIGFVAAEVNLNYLKEIRQNFPIAQQRKLV